MNHLPFDKPGRFGVAICTPIPPIRMDSSPQKKSVSDIGKLAMIFWH